MLTSPSPVQKCDFGFLASPSSPPAQKHDFGIIPFPPLSPTQKHDFGMLASASPEPEPQADLEMPASLSSKTQGFSTSSGAEEPFSTSYETRGEFHIARYYTYLTPFSQLGNGESEHHLPCATSSQEKLENMRAHKMWYVASSTCCYRSCSLPVLGVHFTQAGYSASKHSRVRFRGLRRGGKNEWAHA